MGLILLLVLLVGCAKNQPPTVEIVNPPNGVEVTVGQVIQFEANATDPEGKALKFSWDFGDGALSDQISPNHAYQQSGNYTVNLAITDPEKAQATASILVHAIVNPAGIYKGEYVSGEYGSDLIMVIMPSKTNVQNWWIKNYSFPTPPDHEATLYAPTGWPDRIEDPSSTCCTAHYRSVPASWNPINHELLIYPHYGWADEHWIGRDTIMKSTLGESGQSLRGTWAWKTPRSMDLSPEYRGVQWELHKVDQVIFEGYTPVLGKPPFLSLEVKPKEITVGDSIEVSIKINNESANPIASPYAVTVQGDAIVHQARPGTTAIGRPTARLGGVILLSSGQEFAKQYRFTALKYGYLKISLSASEKSTNPIIVRVNPKLVPIGEVAQIADVSSAGCKTSASLALTGKYVAKWESDRYILWLEAKLRIPKCLNPSNCCAVLTSILDNVSLRPKNFRHVEYWTDKEEWSMPSATDPCVLPNLKDINWDQLTWAERDQVCYLEEECLPIPFEGTIYIPFESPPSGVHDLFMVVGDNQVTFDVGTISIE